MSENKHTDALDGQAALDEANNEIIRIRTALTESDEKLAQLECRCFDTYAGESVFDRVTRLEQQLTEALSENAILRDMKDVAEQIIAEKKETIERQKADLSEALGLLSVAKCPNCDDSGQTIHETYHTIPECCGRFSPHGDCCNNPVPKEVPEQYCEPCEWCFRKNAAATPQPCQHDYGVDEVGDIVRCQVCGVPRALIEQPQGGEG